MAQQAKRISIGDIRVVTGVSQKTGKEYSITKLQFHPSVKILVGQWDKGSKSYKNHQEVDLNEYYGSAEISDAKDDLERLFSSDKVDMSEEQYQTERKRLEDKGIVKNIKLRK